MNLPKYPVVANGTHETYEFLSSGPKGTIKKVVVYQEISPGVYNLAFGDWDEIEQKIKDNTRSNNSDRDIILATVASTVLDFIKHHPKCILFTQGETPAKTRLYQMGINTNWQEIKHLLRINGFIKGIWEPFEPGKNYEAFVLKAK